MIESNDKVKHSLESMRSNLIEQYSNILKTIIYLNSASQSNGTIVESILSLYNNVIRKSSDESEDNINSKSNTDSTNDENNNQLSYNNQQKIIAVMNYLKFTGFIDYYIDNMKK